MKQLIRLRINGIEEEAMIEPSWTLVRVLREEFGLTGTKIGCEIGDCGSCTVLVNGKAIKSCLYLAMKARGKEITTIEGLVKDEKLNPIQQAFVDHFAVQCGFCTPGMILCTKALLDENQDPTEDEIRSYLNGNICRCTGYVKIIEAVMAAKQKIGTIGKDVEYAKT